MLLGCCTPLYREQNERSVAAPEIPQIKPGSQSHRCALPHMQQRIGAAKCSIRKQAHGRRVLHRVLKQLWLTRNATPNLFARGGSS